MSKIAKATVGLMLATMIAKLLGFARELVIASSYGASMYSDAYITSTNIPIVIFSVIGSTLGTVLIPLYFEIKKDKGERIAIKFINNVANIVIIICIFMAILGFIFTEKLVKLFAMGFDGETLKITIYFTRIAIVGVVFSGLSYVMNAFLQIKGNFFIPGIATVPRNIMIIVFILISINYDPYIMIWGSFLGMIIEFLFQIPFAIKKGYRYEGYINIKDQYIKKLIVLIIPVLIGVAVNQVNAMVDKTLASTLAEGSISALNYANKLNLFVMALFTTSVAAVIYPMLSKLSLDDNKDKFISSITTSINSIMLLVIPISIGAIVLAKPIVMLLFERGEFDTYATNMTTIALRMYSLGMLAAGLRDLLGKIFYSIQDTKTPMKNGALAMCMNIVFNILLVRYFELAGLALATSLSSVICTLMLFRSLNLKIGYFGQKKIAKTFFKSVISSIIMGLGTYLVYIRLNNLHQLVILLISILVGIIIYSICILLFNVQEVNIITNIVKDKIKIKKFKVWSIKE